MTDFRATTHPWRPVHARCIVCDGGNPDRKKMIPASSCYTCAGTGLAEIPWIEVQGVEWKALSINEKWNYER